MRKILTTIACGLLCLASVTSCIENDIPYPVVESQITGFEVDGMCEGPNGESAVTINKTSRTVTAYVNDVVDLSKLKITKLTTTETTPVTTLVPSDSALFADVTRFPTKGFASLTELPTSANTHVCFNKSEYVRLQLRTYQDYEWHLSVTRVVKRDVMVDGQVGEAVVDPVNRQAVIYVSPETDVKHLKVETFNIAGPHGKVVPNPVDYPTYDFSQPARFLVSHGWETTSQEWTVYVYKRESGLATATVFPWSTRAYFTGSGPSSKKITLQYKEQSASDWIEANIEKSGMNFTAELKGLKPASNYQYRVLTGSEMGETVNFTTAPAPELPGGSFDQWHSTGDAKRVLWNPWAQGAEPYWGTGNPGATTVGSSNTYPIDDTCDGRGQAALLESKYIVIKFAAGNIFTGTYVETDGTNGILSFGRPFKGFPTKMRVNYKYHSATINKSADDDYKYLIGRPDSCHIYIALADWDEPFEIRTRPSVRHLMDLYGDPHIIALGELIKGDDVDTWTQTDIELKYRYLNRTPTHLVVVASSSKYGDFFTGGEGSKLWIDNFSLLYE
ncbi:MAG: PCMD domain-containing protein [Bacteroidaceae bacterium]|nr:PCMD domain-containing protein [Bacteroidaceae bacterium]